MKAIAAMDLNRVIGNKGKIPWKISDEFQWFKQKTINDVIVMGRTTFDSIGCLPGRFTYVLTSNPNKLSTHEQSILARENKDGLHHCYIQGKDLIEWCQKWPERTNYFWLCGGAKIYQQFLPYCSEVYQSIILDEYEGDTFMPEYEHDFPNSELIMEHKKFWVVRYWKPGDPFLQAGKIKFVI